MNINRILLPLDLQGAASPAAGHAAALARHFHSSVIFLHVALPLSAYAATLWQGHDDLDVTELPQLVRRAQEDLDESLKRVLDGVTVKQLRIESDNPAREIVEVAQSEKADLIVMGTHGYQRFDPSLLGSVTAEVLHASRCPVWTTGHLEDRPPHDFALRSILCAVDLTESSLNTLRSAADMAAEYRARLTLSYIVTGLEMFGPGGTYVDPGWKERLFTSAAAQIAELQQEARTSAEVLIESGQDVGKALSELATRVRGDLLVIGGHPAGDQLTGTGYGLIRASHIPVLGV